MKLIIDIPEEVYKDIKAWKINKHDFRIPLSCILEGIPYEERSQGEWVVYGRQGGIPITDKCSNCGYEMKWYKNKYNFCPNCGADMRGGAE